MQTKSTIAIRVWACAGVWLAACADDPPPNEYPYNLDETRVIGDDTLGSNNGGFDNSTGSVGVTSTSTFSTPDGFRTDGFRVARSPK